MLAEISQSQWGMVTTAQARELGVSHMDLTRLAQAGDMIRLSHGVYKIAAVPGTQHDELRAAWLASEPKYLAWERLRESPPTIVVSGESAADLHGIGDFRAMRSEFTSSMRKQTQRSDVHYRTRKLPDLDVTVREGLPVTTLERTIADLVEQQVNTDHVAVALRDAQRLSSLDVERLVELLSPLAQRNGHTKDDGEALLGELLEAAGLDSEALAERIAAVPGLGAQVARKHLGTAALDSFQKDFQEIAVAIDKTTSGPAFRELIQVADWVELKQRTQEMSRTTSDTQEAGRGDEQ